MEMDKIIGSITYGILVIGFLNVFLPQTIVFGLATLSASFLWINTVSESMIDRILMIFGIFCCLIIRIPLLVGIGLGLAGVKWWTKYNRTHTKFI